MCISVGPRYISTIVHIKCALVCSNDINTAVYICISVGHTYINTTVGIPISVGSSHISMTVYIRV